MIHSLALGFAFVQISIPTSFAAIDLQADLNRIVVGINKFDANSVRSTSATTISDIKIIFSNNAVILKEIADAVAYLKRDLNSAKKYIPSRDTKDSPAFNTLMNLVKGYKGWLKYQYLNQATAQKCLKSADRTFNSFSGCAIASLPKSMENERVGRNKLQSAWNAWKQWQVKYGHA